MMKKQINYGIALCLLLLPLSAKAVVYTWVNWQNTQDWSTPENWNGDPALEPTASDETHINQGAGVLGPVVSTAGAATGRLVMDNVSSLTVTNGGNLTVSGQALLGNGSGSIDNDIVVDGGVLNVTAEFGLGAASGTSASLTVNSNGTVNATGGWMISGYSGGASGDIIIDGGTLNATALSVGWDGAGTLTVNSGVANATAVMNVSVNPTSTGLVEINGGVVTVAGLNVGASTGSSTMNLNGGQLINNGGFVQNANTIFNFDGGELVFTASTVADVNWAIDNGAGTWNFAEFRSVVETVQGIVVSSSSAPTIKEATILSASATNGTLKIVVDAPSDAKYYQPMASSNLVTGVWGSIPHSDGVGSFMITNLDYSATDATGTNKVIYVEADHAQKFFKIDGD